MPSPRRCGCTISSGPVSRRRSARTIYIVIENYVVWKIQDPERFVETVGDAIAAEMRLHDIIWSGLSAALGTHDLHRHRELRGLEDPGPGTVCRDRRGCHRRGDAAARYHLVRSLGGARHARP